MTIAGALVLAARVILAGVFATSAVAKGLDPAGTRRAARELGVPEGLAGAVVVLLPLAEAAAAVLVLLGDPAPTFGGLLAVAMLLAFSAALWRALARGKQTSCKCFGALSTKPLSRRSIYRNLALAAVAAVAAVPGEPAVVRRAADASAAFWGAVALAVVLGGLVAVVAALLRSHGRLLARVEQLEQAAAPPPVDRPAPEFTLPDLAGRPTSLADLLGPGVPVLLLFMSPGCGPCRALAPRVSAWRRRYGDGMTIAVISSGAPEDNREKFGDADVRVLLEQDDAVSRPYGVTATPSALVVTADGQVVGTPAEGAEQIIEVVQALTLDDLAGSDELVRTPVPQVGEPLPAREVLDLDGNPQRLPDALPERAAVLFWDVTCGFARDIADDVKSLRSRDGQAELVVLLRGPAETAGELGFPGSVLLDPHFEVGDAVGAPGTPSAVLVEDGKVASPVAAGGPSVLALLETSL